MHNICNLVNLTEFFFHLQTKTENEQSKTARKPFRCYLEYIMVYGTGHDALETLQSNFQCTFSTEKKMEMNFKEMQFAINRSTLHTFEWVAPMQRRLSLLQLKTL